MAYNDKNSNRVYLDRDSSGNLNNKKSNDKDKKQVNIKSKKASNTSNNSVSKSKKDLKINKANKKVSLDDYDNDTKEAILAEMKRIEKRRKLTVFIFSLIAFICLGYAVYYYLSADKSENRWNEISNMVGKTNLSKPEKTTVTATLSNKETRELTVLPKYETLYNSNKKLIGWLKIDDTIIDYPVMQCDNNTYYLNHNFDQQEDKVGTLFLDYQCDVINGCDNFIIYGHHLQSGRMFSSLEKYENKSYYEKHKYIKFDTIFEEQTFEVMYVFRSRVYNDTDVVFKYYQFINANSEEEFNSALNEMSLISFYDTGVNAYYGDQLLTLSTCDYNENNGRFVVVAKRIK